MATSTPKLLDQHEAAKELLRTLRGQGQDFTIADASAKSGLPFRDAEQGLHALVSEYRGHLRVTEDGELLFRFPHGFTKPWEVPTRAKRFARAVGKAFLGILRFVVRAWITIVLLGYTAIFVAILLGFMFARGSSSDSRDRDHGHGFLPTYLFFRIVSDALFWTFHPFSPVALSRTHQRYRYVQPYEGSAYDVTRKAARDDEENGPRFYDKVNRFFFGPPAPEADPRETERLVLAEIRAQKGRIGLSDVMRVTGLPREQADPMMARLMLDYDGTVEVSDEGGIYYKFPAVRRTAGDLSGWDRPTPIWKRLEKLRPFTGNDVGTNLLIMGLNGFNLFMSAWVMQHGLTLANLRLAMMGIPMNELPFDGTPIALGLVPLSFSILLFAIPLVRAVWRPIEARRIARENGRRAMLREVLEKPQGVEEDSLVDAYRKAAGRDIDSKELTREIVALGGDVDLETADGIRYRFPDLVVERRALEAERETASEEEARVGKIVYSSED
ncbi:MAG: hypothetical protein IPM54_29830 [Polyangiaceae bacterium]|nr:hypothetical protein [Polyangiaceae bacterium]